MAITTLSLPGETGEDFAPSVEIGPDCKHQGPFRRVVDMNVPQTSQLGDGRAIMEINGGEGPQTQGRAHSGAVGSPTLEMLRQQPHKALSNLMLALL